MAYREMYNYLKKDAKDAGVEVKLVSSKTLLDYAGMNSSVAERIGFEIPDDTIYIKKSLSWKERYHTLNHEMVEMGLMGGGKKYWPAHKKALELERSRVIGASYLD